MTGSNFKFLDRNNDRLVKMCAEYNAIFDELRDLWLNSDNDDLIFIKDNQLRARARRIAHEIWCEAFYHYDRSWDSANEYCRNHGVDY